MILTKKRKKISLSLTTLVLLIATTMMILACSPQATASDWPMYRMDSGNTGYSNETINLPLTEQWHSNAPFVEENGVVVSNKIAYMSTVDGYLYAFDVTTGATIPGFPVTTAGSYGTPAVDSVNGLVYVLASSSLYAFHLNGSTAWTVIVGSVGSNYNEGPIIDDGYIYLKAGFNLQKYNATGSLQWSTSTEGYSTQPSIMGDHVYTNSESGSIMKYNKNTGAEITTGGFPLSTPYSQSAITAVDGKLFHKASQVFVYNANDGSLIWSQPAGGDSTYYDSPAVANGVVYVYGYYDSQIYAFDENTGATMAGFPSIQLNPGGDRNWGSPAIADDKVFIGAGTSQRLKVLGAAGSAQAGQVLDDHLTFSTDTQGFDLCSPVISDGVVFAMLDGGGLYAFFGSGINWTGGAIIINNDEECTGSQNVILTLDNGSIPNVVSMRISEDPFFAGVSWEPFATTKPWTLSPGFGMKTVYAQFMDTYGHLSNVFNDQILYSEECGGVEDNTPPTITKTIGNPQYDGGLWVTQDTPITLEATDPGEGASGVKEIHYKINDMETIIPGDHVTFSFQEDCTHTLEFWAVDNAGNEGNHMTQTHYVDSVGPEQTFQFGYPRDDLFFYHDGTWYTGITASTPIWINSTDIGCETGGVGSNFLTYNLYVGETYGEWVFVESQTIHDNEAGDADPTAGRISIVLYMDESCWHQIHYWCYDLLGNRAPPTPDSYLNKDFLVDADVPTTDVSFGLPHEIINNDDYIGCASEIYIYGNDTGCRPGGAGVQQLDWSVDVKVYDDVWEVVQTGTVYDNDTNDLDPTIGEIKVMIMISESCEHHIYSQAIDYLGNIGVQDKKYVRVDCTPPVTTKEIGLPQYYNVGEDIIYVTTSTPITLTSIDEPGPCAVGCEYLHYEIYLFDNDLQDWVLLSSNDEYSCQVQFCFEEECYHKLVWWAVDRFGNTENPHIQYHKVDNTPPTTTLGFGSPQCITEPSQGVFETCITSNTPIYLNAEDGGLCPVGSYIIYYRLWFNGQWTEWMQSAQTTNVMFTMNDLGAPWNQDCHHYIEYYAVDDLYNTEQTQNVSFYVDNTPPVIEKTVGDPNCLIEEGVYCILPTTEITIDAYNTYCCTDTGVSVRYKLNEGTWVDLTELPAIITIPEECEHILTIEATDCLGNTATDVETFYVHLTPPTIIKTIGQPQCEPEEGMLCITPETPITLAATPVGCGDCGPITIEYNIGYEGEWTGWLLYETPITFPEACEHTLMVRAYDCLGNGLDDQFWDTETFHVDDTTPVIEKTIGDPKYDLGNDTYGVTTATDITINSYDLGCCNSLTVQYRINEGDWVDITSMLPYTFNFSEECQHVLDIWAYDCVGHEVHDIETFYVDDTPPIINKIVGDPNCHCAEDEYCVTLDTLITIEAINAGCMPCPSSTIEYRIWYNEQWTDWITYTGPFTFTEECMHQLEIRATDCLGNTATDDAETFYVDITPPDLTKTVGYPSMYFGLDPYGHDQWYVYVETPISFVAEEAESCCPCNDPMIYYRIWYLGAWTDWMIYDEPIYLNRECIHYLEAYAADCLGNAGEIDNETFWVHAPPGYDDPLIAFENPLSGSVHCERTLDVTINASDAQTPTSDLIVKIWMPGGRRNAPTFWYDGVYNPADGFFHASIDLFEYQNGAELTLEAYVIDGDQNYVFALPVTFTVCSNTAYDQWMQLGWNSLVVPPDAIGCENAVENVLASIDGNYDWVFFYDQQTGQWHSYEYGEGGNDLQDMIAGELYWIHMTTADRYYTDGTPPTITITAPLDEVPLNILHEITGTAYDGETGLDTIMVSIHDTNDNKYWDSDSWEVVETELLCTGLDTWMYNTDVVSFINNHTYEITAKAYDNAGCIGTDTVLFLWDANPPIIIILDPIDGEERLSGPDDMNFEVYDLETNVTSVWVEIYDETTGLYYDGLSWQTNQTWLPALYDTDDLYYYPSTGIWSMEVPQTYRITVKAYDFLNNMGMENSTFTIIEPQGECSPDRTYTTDADFDEGILTGVEHETVHNQLQMILGEITTFPTMWIANAGEDSLSKWDTHENIELARYHTWFGPLAEHGAWEGAAPSRTCVDAEGNCYVANRHFDDLPADVIKIYTSDWIDRNGDGQLNTSWDANGNGAIEPEEMLPMTDLNFNDRIDDDEIVDERVAWAVTVGGNGMVGRSLAIDLEGNIWVGMYYEYSYYKISSEDGSLLGGPYYVGSTPYGALVDRYGYLWGSTLGGTLLKLNTHNPTEYENYGVSGTYGITLGYDSLGNTLVYCGGNSPYIVFNSSTESYTYAPNGLFYCLGIATDSEGNIVAGSSGDGSVAKFAPNGDVIWDVPGQVISEVRGIAVDSEDNVWAIHRDMSKLCKYNGTNGAYLGVYDSGYQPYTYSDATGLGYMTSISVGTWDVVYDSYAADTEWNRISWTSDEPEGSSITVKVRSSNDEMSWSPWDIATNGVTLYSTPPGRYLNILTTFEQDPLGESPILYDLTVDGTCAGIVETPHVSMQKQVWVPPIMGEQGGDSGPMNGSEGFLTYTYTLADIVIFGYEDNTTVTIYDYSGVVVWSGTVDDGTYHAEYVSDGVYKIIGDKKYSVLTGDPISDYVMGYYGMDQDGYGASTKLYTYMPYTYCEDYFIVFAYTDNTEVTITNMDTAAIVWSGTLNRGEHYTDETLSANFVKVEANYPVSALSYNDQGYFVPSANQKWSGTEFYTYADDICGWPNTLHVMAYEDNTAVTIKDTDTDVVYWTGTLNAGEDHEITEYNAAYYTILTDKDVTVAVLPVDGYDDGYYYGNYMMDKTGSGIGYEFYIPTLSDSYGEEGMIWTFAFENDTTITVYDAATDVLMGTYHLNQGEAVDVNPGYGYWHIMSDKRISGYSGWGSAAQAAFAPLLFGEAASPGYWAESRDAIVGDTVRFKISIVNDGQCDFLSGCVTDYLPNSLQYIEGSANITVTYNGETWYANETDKEPWIFPGSEYTTLLWNGSGAGEGYPSSMKGYFEFEAQVVDCSEPIVVNIANVSVEPACGDILTAQDTASVNIQCGNCTPTGTVDKMVWDENAQEWVPSIQAEIGEEVSFGIHAIIPEDACTLYEGYMEDYLPDGLTYITDSTNIIIYYGGNLYQNLTGSVVEPHITDYEGYVTLLWDSQNGYAEELPATGEVYISYRAEVMNTGIFVNVANGTGYTESQIRVNDQGNATVYVQAEIPIYSLSGTIYNAGSGYGPVIISLVDTWPPETILDFVILDSSTLPAPYWFDNLTAGTYYVEAFLDIDGNYVYDNDEPFGFAINKTEDADPLTIVNADFTGADITLANPQTLSSPFIDITYPEDGDWFNYTQEGELTITGIAYDVDTYVDEVQVTLSYIDNLGDTYYYNMTGSWSLTPYTFTVDGTGSGTMADPLIWQLIVEPAFPIEYYMYDVYATAFDHDAIPLSNSDANWFWYPEPPLENNAPYIPTNLEPSNGLIGVGIDPNLYWTGGDPDAGDTVSYEIHFGTDPIPSAIITVGPYDNSTTMRMYDLATLDYGTQYYWYIIATDNHNAYSIGPIWNFTTVEE